MNMLPILKKMLDNVTNSQENVTNSLENVRNPAMPALVQVEAWPQQSVYSVLLRSVVRAARAGAFVACVYVARRLPYSWMLLAAMQTFYFVSSVERQPLVLPQSYAKPF